MPDVEVPPEATAKRARIEEAPPEVTSAYVLTGYSRPEDPKVSNATQVVYALGLVFLVWAIGEVGST